MYFTDVRGFNASQVNQYLLLTFSIDRFKATLNASIAKQLSRECLMGWDTYCAHGIVTDGEEGEVRCGGLTAKNKLRRNYLPAYLDNLSTSILRPSEANLNRR